MHFDCCKQRFLGNGVLCLFPVWSRIITVIVPNLLKGHDRHRHPQTWGKGAEQEQAPWDRDTELRLWVSDLGHQPDDPVP